MTVKEFCEKYEISHQAVYAKIQKKSDVLKGHISKRGCLVLDEFAVQKFNRVLVSFHRIGNLLEQILRVSKREQLSYTDEIQKFIDVYNDRKKIFMNICRS